MYLTCLGRVDPSRRFHRRRMLWGVFPPSLSIPVRLLWQYHCGAAACSGTWRTAQSQNIGGVVNIILYLFYVGCGYVRPFSEAIYDHCISQHQFTSSVKAIQDSLLDLCLLEMSAWWQSPRALTWMVVLWSLRFNTALTSSRSSIEGTEFNSNNNDMYAHSPREPKKAVKSKPSYSSSGKSSKPSRRFFWLMGPLVCFALLAAAAASSSSLVRRKRSKTRSVSIDDNPEFCCVTTECAMLSLNRCSLNTSSVR